MQKKNFILFAALISFTTLQATYNSNLPARDADEEQYQNNNYLPNSQYQNGPFQRGAYESPDLPNYYDAPYIHQEYNERGTYRSRAVANPKRYNFDNQEIIHDRESLDINYYKPGASSTGGGSTSTSRPFTR